ncbi:hypothetical protein [Leifsonia shinshuensis]|uniref:Alternate-type signal peptide domain-containing protein n=1 Tax=Leifsonia shinshuensis TaxID=150026 RepID=A0A7G6Y799_9MICO|nr:hypothetical protein [Leifsonia shinshuensis]QNE34364.1 hypothetical protein F1C12_03915 [Leifsonia shinshuensis]
MTPPTLPARRWRRPVLAAVGVCVASAIAVTAASTVNWSDVIVALDGSDNTFDLQVAGSDVPGWQPTAAEWQQGRPDPVVVALPATVLEPGTSVQARVAVRNSSPRLAGSIRVHLVDPATPNALFPELRFTISEGGHVYAAAVPPTGAADIPLTGATAPGEDRVLDVEVALPADAPASVNGSVTPIRLMFTGVNL